MYLLSVLSSDRTAEITFLLSLNSSYSTIPPALPSRAVSTIHRTALSHHTHRFYNPTYAKLITSLTAESRLEGGSSTGGYASTSKDQSIAPAGARSKSKTSTSDSQSQSQSSFQAQSQSQAQTQASQSQSSRTTEDDASGTLRSQYGRFLPPPPTSPPSRHAYLSTLEEVLGKYYNVEKEAGRLAPPGQIQGQGEEVNWVYLATPFVCCFARPVAVFLAFQKMMDRIRESRELRKYKSADGDRNVPAPSIPPGFAVDPLSPGPAGIVCLFRRRAGPICRDCHELVDDNVVQGDVAWRRASSLG